MGDLIVNNSYFEDNFGLFNSVSLLSIDNSNFTNNSLSICNVEYGASLNIFNSNFKNCTDYYQSSIKTNIFTISGQGAVTLVNTTFEDNYASGNSYIIYTDGNLNILNSIFENNSALRKGIVHAEKMINIIDSNFTNNHISSDFGIIDIICSGKKETIEAIEKNIENCSFINNSLVSYGAIKLNNVVGLNITNCDFIDCSANNGSAIYLSNSSMISINDCDFIDCSANRGGAINIGENSSNVAISNSKFANNHAEHLGGTIYVNGNNTLICNCSFSENCCGDYGGAIYVEDNVNEIRISDSKFNENAVRNDIPDGTYRFGGAICSLAQKSIITNCSFTENNCIDGAGAIYIGENSSGNISNSKFLKNYITGDFLGENNGGGAILSLSNDLVIDNSTFVSNQALSSFGGAIRLIVENEDPVFTVVENSVFLGNKALMGKYIYTDESVSFISNEFMYLEYCEDIVFGISEDLLSESNLFIESKMNSTISVQNLNITYGESIFIPIVSEYIDSVHIKIINKGDAVVYEEELPIGDTLSIPQLSAGNYRVILDSIVDESVFNPSSCESVLIIEPAGSSVSTSSVSEIYGKKVNINIISNNATGIKYVIKNAKGTTVKSGTVASGKAITGLLLAAGTYTLSLTAVVDNNHASSSASSKITINKATATITAKALTTYYSSGKTWSINLKDKTNNKFLASKKLTLKVYTGSKYKTYTVITNSKGVATFKASTLAPGSHKVVVSYSNGNYTTKSVTTTLKVNKMALSYKVSRSTQKDSASLQIWVKNKATKKAINKIKIKLLVYTGKKYKTISLVTGKYSSKGNGYAGYAVKGPVYSVGTHTIKIMAGDSYHTGSVKSSLVLKSTVKKYSKKVITISKGKRTVKKG